MTQTLHYLFDPLCGWCYGATPAIRVLEAEADIELELCPTGLFAGEHARPMDDAFAAYAWSNDQRIERLTTQPFTERYRLDVLGNRHQLFDSGPATVALTAVSMTSPDQELPALKAIQHARYVDARDITNVETLAAVLRDERLTDAATVLEHRSANLIEATRARIRRAQALMHEFKVQGVPAFILESAGTRRTLPASAVFTNPRALLEQATQA